MDSIVLGITLVTVLIAVVVAGKLFIRWRRNRYRFSMRAQLLAFAVVGCGLFAILRLVVPTLEHRWAIRQIHVSGATTRFPEDYASYEEQQQPGYQSSRNRRNYWRNVSRICVSGDREAIAVARQLTAIPELESVDLSRRYRRRPGGHLPGRSAHFPQVDRLVRLAHHRNRLVRPLRPDDRTHAVH